MIDEKEIRKIKKDLEEFDSRREEIIKISRDVLRYSKHAIFSIHNEDMKKAESNIKSAEKEIKKIQKIAKKASGLENLGAISQGMQEYVEAKTYFGFVKDRRLPSCKSLGSKPEDYLLGLCDLTGELGRRAVISVINGNTEEVYLIKETVEKIFGLFLEMNLRNGELRKKSDSIKWNLNKIESIIYDLKTRGIDKLDKSSLDMK